MAKTKNQVDRAQTTLDKLVEMFTSEDLPERVARTVIHRHKSDSPSAVWSLTNQLTMFLNDTHDARGYRQWETVGRKVKKGAKAFYILAPITRTITDEDDNGEKTTRRIPVGFKGVPVFRVEDTEGEHPVPPPPDYTPIELPPLFEVAQRFGVPVEWQPFFGDAYGSYYHGGRKIVLRTHDVGTFFHELAHAAHEKIEPLVGGQNPRQEVIAETVAAVLCLMYGASGRVAGSKDYVESYARQDAGKAVVKVLSTVQKILSLILDGEEDQ